MPKNGTLFQWFYEKIDFTDNCWEWTGAKSRGRAMFALNGSITQASRVAYWLWYEVWPGKWNVCHTCDNGGCVNPDHLFLGTDLDNKRDCVNKGRAKTLHAKGEFALNRKLTRKIIAEAKELRNQGWIWKDIARKYSVHYTTLIHAVNGDCWNKGDSYSFEPIARPPI